MLFHGFFSKDRKRRVYGVNLPVQVPSQFCGVSFVPHHQRKSHEGRSRTHILLQYKVRNRLIVLTNGGGFCIFYYSHDLVGFSVACDMLPDDVATAEYHSDKSFVDHSLSGSIGVGAGKVPAGDPWDSHGCEKPFSYSVYLRMNFAVRVHFAVRLVELTILSSVERKGHFVRPGCGYHSPYFHGPFVETP